MKKQVILEFEDESAKATGNRHDAITQVLSEDELLKRVSDYGDAAPFISGNSSGLVALGKLLIQMGMSEYGDGFHVHIYEDFNSDKSEILVVRVDNSIGSPK